MASVMLTPDSTALYPAQSVSVTAVLKGANGNTLQGRTITWALSDTTLAQLSASGATAQVVAKKVGAVTVMATSEQRSASARVLVRAVPVASLAVSPAAASLVAGRTTQLVATARDSAGGALADRAVAWTTSDSSVATVSSSGLVRGAAVGTARITASVEGRSTSVAVTVTPSASSGTWAMPTEFVGTYWVSPSATLNFIPFGQAGDFNGDGLTDVVITSWTLSMNSADWSSSTINPAALVKIYLRESSGGFEDATARLLGAELMAFTQLPLVADVNRDGIDDIVLPGFTDLPPIAAPGMVLVSSSGRFVKRELPKMWAHGLAIADADGDGCLDIITPNIDDAGFLRGDCNGGFQSRPWAPDGAGWVTGMHACVADFDGDGKQDVVISSTPWAVDGVDWKEQSNIQVYLNRGNWQFEDISDRAFPGRSGMTQSSFSLQLRDLDGDGRLDLIYPAETYAGATNANQVWYGTGNGGFTPAPGVDFPAMLRSAHQALKARRGSGSVPDQTMRQVVPLPRADGRFDFVVPVTWTDAQDRVGLDLEFVAIGWAFR